MKMSTRAMETPILMFFMALALMSGRRVGAVDCSSLILNMADCLSFVMSGSTVVKPEGTCCSGLKTVVRSGPQCICDAFKNSASLGVTLDLAKAASLPTVCKVAAPPSARCGLSVSASPPATAPGLSPTSGAGAPGLVSGADAPELSGGAKTATPPVSISGSSHATFLYPSLASAVFMMIIIFSLH